MTPPPVPDPATPGLVADLRDALDRADYRAGPVTALLARPDFAVRPVSRGDRPRLLYRARGDDPLAVLTRLFLLGDPVEFAVLRRVCPLSAPDRWREYGLLRADGDRVTARFQVVPFGPYRFATDARWEYSGQPDAVMPLTNSTALLRQCLIDSPTGDVLDLGTGNGVLAVHAARWAGRVVATDLSGRAVALASFNAALNGVAVEFRTGRWSDPVAGERFDRVVCNPPFAIGPRVEVLFRDSGEPGDGLSERLIREAAGLLRPGGFAQVLINWVHPSREDWSVRVRGWVAGTGCDAHVLGFQTVLPEDYVGWWLPRAEDAGADELQARFDEWLGYLEGLGAGVISYGLITLRARPGCPNWFVADRSPPRAGACGPDIASEFTRRDLLEADIGTLLRTRLRVADGVRVEQGGWPAGGEPTASDRWLVRTAGLCHRFPATPLALALVRGCGAGRMLADVLRDIGWPGGDGSVPALDPLLSSACELVLTGYLVPVKDDPTELDLLTDPIAVD